MSEAALRTHFVFLSVEADGLQSSKLTNKISLKKVCQSSPHSLVKRLKKLQYHPVVHFKSHKSQFELSAESLRSHLDDATL